MLDVFESYGFETDDELTEDRKVEALNETYFDALSRQAWPFLEDWQAARIYGSGNGKIEPIATDAYPIRQIQKIWKDGGPVLRHARLDDIADATPTSSDWNSSGSPRHFYFIGDSPYAFPPPLATEENWNIMYIRGGLPLTATSIESAILIPERFHRSVLVMGTLSRLAVMQDDTDLGAAYERLYEKALAGMVQETFTKQFDRADYIHVYDPDNWDYS